MHTATIVLRQQVTGTKGTARLTRVENVVSFHDCGGCDGDDDQKAQKATCCPVPGVTVLVPEAA